VVENFSVLSSQILKREQVHELVQVWSRNLNRTWTGEFEEVHDQVHEQMNLNSSKVVHELVHVFFQIHFFWSSTYHEWISSKDLGQNIEQTCNVATESNVTSEYITFHFVRH
jgi:hypothetical protein